MSRGGGGGGGLEMEFDLWALFTGGDDSLDTSVFFKGIAGSPRGLLALHLSTDS